MTFFEGCAFGCLGEDCLADPANGCRNEPQADPRVVGNRIVARVPWPGRLVMSKRPPKSAARSPILNRPNDVARCAFATSNPHPWSDTSIGTPVFPARRIRIRARLTPACLTTFISSSLIA